MGARERPSLWRFSLFAVTWQISLWLGWGPTITWGSSAVIFGRMSVSWSIRHPGWPSWASHAAGALAGPAEREPTVVMVMLACSSAVHVGIL